MTHKILFIDHNGKSFTYDSFHGLGVRPEYWPKMASSNLRCLMNLHAGLIIGYLSQVRSNMPLYDKRHALRGLLYECHIEYFDNVALQMMVDTVKVVAHDKRYYPAKLNSVLNGVDAWGRPPREVKERECPENMSECAVWFAQHFLDRVGKVSAYQVI